MSGEFEIPPTHPSARAFAAKPHPSPIDLICDEVVAQLEIKLPGKVKVEHFPDKPAEYDFEGYDAAALVIYDGSRFDKAGLAGAQGVREEVRLVVSLLVRTVRGPTGAYGLIHDIRSALHGASFGGSVGLKPVETELEREQDGVFQYRLVFEGAVVAVPVKSSGVALPRGFENRR